MSGPLLSEYQAEAAAAAATAQAPAGSDVEEKNGQHAEGGSGRRRTARWTYGWASIAGKQWHHSTKYANVWRDPAPNSSDPNSDNASSPTARHGSRTCCSTAAWWDSTSEWAASSTPPSPPVSAHGRWSWWRWGLNELSPTSAADAFSNAAAAAA